MSVSWGFKSIKREGRGGVNIMLECLHLFVNTYIFKISNLYFEAKVKNEGEINKKSISNGDK